MICHVEPPIFAGTGGDILILYFCKTKFQYYFCKTNFQWVADRGWNLVLQLPTSSKLVAYFNISEIDSCSATIYKI